jgi:hypothetical protein
MQQQKSRRRIDTGGAGCYYNLVIPTTFIETIYEAVMPHTSFYQVLVPLSTDYGGQCW